MPRYRISCVSDDPEVLGSMVEAMLARELLPEIAVVLMSREVHVALPDFIDTAISSPESTAWRRRTANA